MTSIPTYVTQAHVASNVLYYDHFIFLKIKMKNLLLGNKDCNCHSLLDGHHVLGNINISWNGSASTVSVVCPWRPRWAHVWKAGGETVEILKAVQGGLLCADSLSDSCVLSVYTFLLCAATSFLLRLLLKSGTSPSLRADVYCLWNDSVGSFYLFDRWENWNS